MAVSSQRVFLSGRTPSVPVLEGMQSGRSLIVEDEEFPSDLASNYDRMLQPDARRIWPKILVAVALVAVLLGSVSVYTLYNSSKSEIFVLTGSR